ncbi:hypothetical protein [Synechococcus sp. PCC 7336]|uniref:DprA-like winged helix domain-containing protein n=1 Tax=Synechococcus sp. PCC 7336 TaxID=195250 RepID=UPI00034A1219|nr:hypothetical protein [Synechococcus sp. PCC 7336]
MALHGPHPRPLSLEERGATASNLQSTVLFPFPQNCRNFATGLAALGDRDRRFFLEDVNAVINAPNFYRDGNAYFAGVWGQAETTAPQGQTQILKALSHTPLSLAELFERLGLTAAESQAAIATLESHDVIARQADGTYIYTVELMRRWVVQNLDTL